MQLFRQIQIYIPLFKSGWWLVALSILFAITLSLYTSYTAIPVYQTSVKVIILPNPLMAREADELKAQEILEERILAATHVERLISNVHRQQTAPLLPLTPAQLETLGQYTVNAVVLPQTSVIDLFVNGPDPDVARILANGLAEQGILVFQQHYSNLYRMEFLDPALTPTKPISPTPTRDAPLAAFLGLAFGVALLISYEQVRWFLSETSRENQGELATADSLPASPSHPTESAPSTNGRHPEHDSANQPTRTS
jgi:capsular polysaccharide biosynthesis protein